MSEPTSNPYNPLDRCMPKTAVFIRHFIEYFQKKLLHYQKICEDKTVGKPGKYPADLDNCSTAVNHVGDNSTTGGIQVIVKPLSQLFTCTDSRYHRNKAFAMVYVMSQIYGKVDLLIALIACDICRMFLQPISLLSDEGEYHHVKLLAKDCVQRIIKYIHFRWDQFRFNIDNQDQIFSLFKANDGKDLKQKFHQLAKYVIAGIWYGDPKRYPIRRWMSGINIKAKLNGQQGKSTKINSNNILRRLHIQQSGHHCDYFFVKTRSSTLQKCLAKLGLMNGQQDALTKQLGYRITSLIDPEDEINPQTHQLVTQPIQAIPISSYLISITKLHQLKRFAEKVLPFTTRGKVLVSEAIQHGQLLERKHLATVQHQKMDQKMNQKLDDVQEVALTVDKKVPTLINARSKASNNGRKFQKSQHRRLIEGIKSPDGKLWYFKTGLKDLVI